MNHIDLIETVPGVVQTNLFNEIDDGPQPDIRNGRKSSKKTSGKHFVLDTNVLLHDPTCIRRFADNHVWIPVDVLAELDRFKNEQSERGANARAIHRALVQCFGGTQSGVTRGIPTPGGGTLRLAVFDLQKTSKDLARLRRVFHDLERVDHRILANVVLISAKTEEPAILVTKDLNLQLKAMAVGLACEDYLNDKVAASDIESYELRRIEIHPHEMQRFASSGELRQSGSKVGDLSVNEYVLLVSGDCKTMPARLREDHTFKRLNVPEHIHIPKGISLRPMNLGQQCFLDALLDPALSLVTCYGQAGTGKTLLAVAAGLHDVMAKQYNGITISRPVVAMGDTLGYLPGTLDEKMRPWLQPIYDALELLMPPNIPNPVPDNRKAKKKATAQPSMPAQIQHGAKPYEALIDQGIVEIEALCYIRGRSIPRRFFVLDEAQQLTPLEAKTVVTRMSKGSKLVLVGDPGQIDNPYVDSRSNGLVYTRNRLKGEVVAAHVTLCKGERSPLAELGAKLM